MVLYQISHQTTYSYSQVVRLKPHLIRLRPRCDGWQKLKHFSLSVQPQPQGTSELLDLDGNSITKLWFTKATDSLSIQMMSRVETCLDNPFNYLLESWATTLPFDYPSSLLRQLKPYLQPYGLVVDTSVLELAQDLIQATHGNTLNFLSTLNQRIYEDCKYLTREHGAAWQPGVTWRRKQGSCRDYTVLFMEVCRAVGLAVRFVSGYQEGDPDLQERDLHAWAEVYLPGGGWRGYDPTLGLAVSDRHMALAASAIPDYTTPVLGSIIPIEFNEIKRPTSEMNAQIVINKVG